MSATCSKCGTFLGLTVDDGKCPICEIERLDLVVSEYEALLRKIHECVDNGGGNLDCGYCGVRRLIDAAMARRTT